MNNNQFRVGEILRLDRRPVTIEPLTYYEEIGVRSFGKGVFHKEPVSGAEIGAKRVFHIRPGDLIFHNIFAWEGAVALASESEQGKVGSHRFLTYVTNSGVADASYLRYFFCSEPGTALLLQASPGSAGRNRTLAIDRFEQLRISLPELQEQRRIAGRLDGLFLRLRRLAPRSQRAAAIAKVLPAALAHRKDLGGDAKRTSGWIEASLAELLRQTFQEESVDPEEGYPNVGVLSFARGLFEKDPIDGARTKATKLYRIRAGQFIYSRLFAFEGAYAVVDDQYDGYFVSSEFPTFSLDTNRVDAGFLAAYFSAPWVWEELAVKSKGLGLRRQRVQPDHLLAHRIGLPPLEYQQTVARAMVRLRAVESLRSGVDHRLKSLEKSILNGAFAREL